MKKLFTILLIIAASAIPYTSLLNNSNVKNINTYLQQQVTKHHTPSVYYTFFDADAIIYQASYGQSRIKEALAVSSKNTYNVFSITKTFTAVAVLQLVQQKKLKLDDKVIDYLPDFIYGNEVTIEQLLTHSAGIPNPLPLKWIHLVEEHKTFNYNEYFSTVISENSKLKSSPGAKFAYSNLGYVILGQIIESVSGKAYEDYVQEHIIKRLGLEGNQLGFEIDTNIHVKGYQKRLSFTNLLLSVLLDKRKFMDKAEGNWQPFKSFYINGTAYGGLIASPVGLVKYAQALISKDTLLINEESKKHLFAENTIDGKKTGMCYSWFTGYLKGNRYYHHAGGGGGYYIELRLYPELGVGSVILFNRTGMTDERLLDKTDAFFISKVKHAGVE
jgi:CubicO group peptidase (beta-lactamase class C family)